MKSAVKNAADEQQVKDAVFNQKLLREREVEDLKVLMAQPEFRRFAWRALAKCNVFGSVWENSARIHFNAGQQDIGHWLMAEIAKASEEGFLQMMKENRGEIRNG